MKNIEILFSLLLFFSIKPNSFGQGPDCASATQLSSVTNFCSGAAVFTNSGSTSSTLGLPICWAASASEDVWFQFTAIGTDVLISAGGAGNGGTMMQPRIALYTGSCTGTMNEVGCSNGSGGSGVTQLYEGAMSIGTVYYIRVSTTNTTEGTFELCVNNYTPSANPGADCGGAAFLCNQNPVSVGTLNGGGLNNDEPESTSCLESPGPDEGNSSWFYWTCGAAGTLTFDITPLNPTDDIDFIFYQLNSANPCGTRTILRCNSSSCLNSNGSTGLSMTDTDFIENPNCDPGENAYCQFINMIPGVSYALLVNNFSANMGFTANFGGTATFQGPNPVITTNTNSICSGQSIIFSANTSTNVGGGLNWNFLNGGSPTSATGVGPHTITYNSPGVFTAILLGTDASGCQSTEVEIITVTPQPTAPIVNPVSYCQGETAVQLTATGTGLLWYSTPTGGIGSSTAPIPATNVIGTTSYYVSQSPAGCESTRVQIIVTVDPPPTMVLPVDISQCANSTILASSFNSIPNGAIFSWTNSNTAIGLGASGSGNIQSFTGINGTGSNIVSTISVISTIGTCVGPTVEYTITIYPLPLIDAGSDLEICNGTPIVLNGLGAPTFNWSDGVIDGVPFIPSITTTYILSGTSVDGCINSDQVQVTVNPTPAVNAGADLTVCDNQSIVLSGSGAATYSWDNGITNGVNFILPAGTVTFSVIGTTADGCIGTDQVNVTVIPASPVTFSADTLMGCAPLTVNFTNTTIDATDCFWEMSDGSTMNGCGTVTNIFSQAGCYDITLTTTSPNGCINSFTTLNLICAEGAPNAAFVPSSNMISELYTEVYFINLTSGANTYEWSFYDGSPISTAFNPSFDYNGFELGNYDVMLVATSLSGCTDTTYGIIQIYEELIYYVPNTFTPDSDEFNQTFQPIFTSGFDPYDYHLSIFNRWGELIFESYNSEMGWDGTYGGEITQDGVYTWTIDFKMKENDEHKKVFGNVNLLR